MHLEEGNKPLVYPEQSYRICLNCQNPDENLGLENYKFREMRLWRTRRTIAQIKNSRFQQLDMNKDGISMVSYFRLNSGGVADEVNFANLTQKLTKN